MRDVETKDIVDAAVPFVFDKATTLAIGGLVVWLIKGGGVEKVRGWWKSSKAEIREEAQEAPKTEVKMLREHIESQDKSIAKQDTVIVGMMAKIETLLTKIDTLTTAHHQCEVIQARQAEKILFLEQKVELLENPDTDTEEEGEQQQ
jgi:hypothetical protein